jgi:hypothetical protein
MRWSRTGGNSAVDGAISLSVTNFWHIIAAEKSSPTSGFGVLVGLSVVVGFSVFVGFGVIEGFTVFVGLGVLVGLGSPSGKSEPMIANIAQLNSRTAITINMIFNFLDMINSLYSP